MNNKPVSIAFIRQRYNPFGGAERFMERALQALQARGIQLTLITRRWDTQQDNGIRKLVCKPLHIGSLWRHWSFSRCVCKTVKQEQFDLVQSHERLPCCDIYRAGDGVHREWLQQRKRILGRWGQLAIRFSLYHYYLKQAESRLFHSSRLKMVICNSHMVKAEIQHYFGLPEDKLTVIYNGVDSDVFHPGLKDEFNTMLRQQYGIPLDASVFLYVGSGFERKGLDAVIRAFAQLPANTHLLVVGKDRRLKQYQQLAQRLGVAARVHFAGGQKEVRPYYGAADVFLLPTLYDPLPNAGLEAMACGLPTITSTKSGLAELIEHGKNGYVFDALDIQAMANTMQTLLDATLRTAIGNAARTTITPLTLENMGLQLEKLYTQLLTA